MITLVAKRRVDAAFVEVLKEIVGAIELTHDAIIPEVIAILNSIELFTSSEKAKEIISKIIKLIQEEDMFNDDIVALINDLIKVLS